MELNINTEDRLAPPRKSNNKPIIIATVLACSVAGGVGWKLYQEDLAKTRQLESLARHNAALILENEKVKKAQMLAAAADRKTERTPSYYELNPRAQAQQKTVRPKKLIEPEKPKLKPGERQTVFNDDNYKPKGAINSVAPPSHRHFVSNTQKRPAAAPAQQRVAPWKWESIASGGRKKWTSGNFTYMVQSGRVDTASVCKNEKHGSFRYRDCRKGAKAYFTDRCRSGDKVACTGQSMAL